MVIALTSSTLLSAQTTKMIVRADSLPYNPLGIKVPTDPTVKINPLSPYTFDKFLYEGYNFAILGSSTPSTGLKFETIKPSVTLSGNLHAKNGLIINLELSAGAKDGLGDIFSKDKLNGFFKVSAGFNFLSSNNGATPKSDTTFMQRQTKLHNKAKLYDSLVNINNGVRKAVIYKTLAHPQLIANPSSQTFASIYTKLKGASFVEKNEKRYLDSIFALYDIQETDLDKSILAFVNKWKFLLSNPGALANTASDTTKFMTRYKALHFEQNLKKAQKLYNLAQDTLSNIEMRYFKNDYNRVKIKWWNFTPAISNSAFHLYDPVALGITSRHSLGLEMKVSYNWLFKYPAYAGKFIYLSFGLTPKRMNSLDDIDNFSYKKSTQIKVGTNETLTEEETGNAYSGNYKNGFGLDIFAEGYWCFSKKRFIPGLYGKISYNYGYPLVNDKQIPLEMGLIYNLASNDKDSKNLLSVIPYVGWTNINHSLDYATRTPESLHSKFNFGLKVGVPINIGK
ncbi:MAG: hypothetical protein EOO42_12725 [Flavobacteriales bacterium]|nr:MAG: hypothetical protein EOO42_12725 [Flavobacteriales bacterium]